MIKIKVQYFDGFPNSAEMIHRVTEAIAKSQVTIELKEVLVDTAEKAEQYKFRGSPTVVINGIDLEGLPEPGSGTLACRYYINGLPAVEMIIKTIQNIIKIER
jgi:hypothetical protein